MKNSSKDGHIVYGGLMLMYVWVSLLVCNTTWITEYETLLEIGGKRC